MRTPTYLFCLIPFCCMASPILDLLQITPCEQSQDFINNKKQFQLHSLLTEQRHSKTWDLSSKIQANTERGIEALLSVDEDISNKFLELAKDTTILEQAACAIEQAILQNRKIYIYGCGATGRLAKQVESSFWRPFWRKIQKTPHWRKIQEHFSNIENRLIGEMTGGDRALISSLEGFEDLPLIGKLQLEDHQVELGDVVFAITEGGETPSVIGAMMAALEQYGDLTEATQIDSKKHLYFIYNNPDPLLLTFERSKQVIVNGGITKISLFTGPQAVTGSTRMQATTSETFVMGIILEQALYQLLQPYLNDQDLAELGFQKIGMRERLLSFLPIQQAVYKTNIPISHFTDLEASTYAKGYFSTYMAEDALITVFIDSTERAPTFRLFPLDTIQEPIKKSWIQVWLPAQSQLEAWHHFLGRPFYGLKKERYEGPFVEGITDPFLRTAALSSLSKAGDDQQYLYDFSYAKEQSREPKENDLGVLALFSHEINQLLDANSSFQSYLMTFEKKKSSIAVILVTPHLITSEDPVIKKIELLAPQAEIVQLIVNDLYDPLHLRQHIGLKMLLNAHSTGVMAKLGRLVGNTMTSVNPGNLKLIGRATFLISTHVNAHFPEEDKISYSDANAVLFDAIEHAKRVQKVGQNAEVGVSIIRILESYRLDKAVAWETAELILQTQGLENYLKGK